MQNSNFEKYLTAETGNPTQKGNRKYRIPILRNTLQLKREIQPKMAIVNTEFQF